MGKYRIFLFTVPAVIVLGAFFLYPIGLSLRLSFTDFTGVGIPRDIGWRNYERIFTRSRYVDALGVTLLFTLVVVTVQTAIGLFCLRLAAVPLALRYPNALYKTVR